MRYAVSADGNRHDQDDIIATPLTLALFAAADKQDDLNLYVYNDHVWDTDPEKQAMMSRSVFEAAYRFECWDTNFVSAYTAPSAAVHAMKIELNKSTAENPLTVLMAGPSYVIARAVELANPAALPHVTVVSHSHSNNTHAEEHNSTRTWESMADSGVNLVKIQDQNILLNTAFSPWFWLEHANDPDMAWIYTRNQKSTFDVSDSGMAYYALTGDPTGTPLKFEIFFQNPGAFDFTDILQMPEEEMPLPTDSGGGAGYANDVATLYSTISSD